MSETPLAEMSFEDAMRELEQVVAKLETGDVALEAPIALYQRGADLKAHCEAKLKSAEEKSPGQWQFAYAVSVEIEGEEKPALICEWITQYFV